MYPSLNISSDSVDSKVAVLPRNARDAAGQERKPRLAYLVSRYPAVSHTFILREVCELRARGLEVEVASVNEPDRDASDMSESEHAEFRRTYYLKRHGVVGAVGAHLRALRKPWAYLRGLANAMCTGGLDLGRAAYGLFYYTEALMLHRWMEQRGLEHLHVHFATAAANVGLLLKHSHNIGFWMTVHGPDEFYDAPGQQLGAKLRAADFVVCIGRFARSQVMKLSPARYWNRFEICPLGVDPVRYKPASEVSADKPFTILCVGRLAPAKGQRILIDAARDLVASGRRFRLVMVGTGPDADDLLGAVQEYGLEEYVTFTGALNEAQVLDWYTRADAFALPSFAEGIPVVLMEAMASGVPCVTTRITGIPELVRDREDGLLVTPSDSHELAETLSLLMDEPGLRQRLARSGRARVREHFDLQRNVDRLAQIFARRMHKVAQ